MVITSPILKWLVVVQTFLLLFLAILYTYLIFFGPEGRNENITNFDECVTALGSLVQESYPAVCVTRQKNRFVQVIEPLDEESGEPILTP